jgi:hypothetical protein
MSDLNRGERLQIMLTEEELKALDDWRFSRRMPSRAAAVRELLRLGLAAQGFNLADDGRKSQDFGVMGGGKSDHASQAAQPPKMDGAGD